jgi:2-C-methyl-D-erythritol 4-phosphate cytidylyltransferase
MPEPNSCIAAVVTAAGSSARMADGDPRFAARPIIKKEYRELPGYTDEAGRPLTVLGAAVGAFAGAPAIAQIVVTVPPDRENAEDEARAALPRGLCPGILFVRGGETRRVSVFNALKALYASGRRYDVVLIHDGARPWASTTLINAVIRAALVHGAAIPVVPAVETPKVLDSGSVLFNQENGLCAGFITQHPRRETLVFAQTPQGFAFGPLLEAHEKAEEAAKNGVEFTDDAGVWAFAWPEKKVAAVPGEASNKKITFPEDLAPC